MSELTSPLHSLNETLQIVNPIYNIIEKPIKRLFPKDWYIPGRTLHVPFHGLDAQFYAERKKTETATIRLGKEEPFLAEFLSALRPHDEVWDIGAYVGVWSVFAALQAPLSHITAFEPSSVCVKEIEKNRRINGLEQIIRIMPVALYNSLGNAALYGNGLKTAASCLQPVKGMVETESTKLDTGDRLVLSSELASPTILKCDVEGAEVNVLRGMDKLLHGSKAPHDIFVEAHPQLLFAFDSNMDEFIETLARLPYHVLTEQPRDRTIHFHLQHN